MEIPAAASEDPPPRRGRPKPFPPLGEASPNPLGLSQARRNDPIRRWALKGLGPLLGNWDPSFKWLLDEDSPRVVYRRMIVAELGRIDDDQEILRLARLVCRRKLPTRDAVALIRRCRIGRPPRSRSGLAKVVTSAVRSYIAAHAGTAMGEIAGTLRELADAYEEREEVA